MNLEKINVGGNEYDICDAKTRAMVSDEYDPEGDYVAGDLCIHDNKLHEAKGPTTGAWDSTKWEGRTLAEVLKSQNSNIQNIWSKIYPVGSIYMSANATNPGNLFGGTWEQIQGRFLLAAGGGYSAGETGGEATHKLMVSEMPAHTHGIDYQGIYGATSGVWNGGVAATGSGTVQTKSTGGGGSHNNMPPYIVVYVWKRTA